MDHKYRMICRCVSRIWMAICGAALVWFSLYSDSIRSVYVGKVIGVCGTFAVLVLTLIDAVSGEIPEVGITPEHGGRKHVFYLSRIFFAGLILQILYAGYGICYGRTSLLTDSMATAGIFCVTVLAAERKLRCVSGKSVLN